MKKVTKFCPLCHKMFEIEYLTWYIPGPEKNGEDEPDGKIICPRCAENDIEAEHYIKVVISDIVKDNP